MVTATDHSKEFTNVEWGRKGKIPREPASIDKVIQEASIECFGDSVKVPIDYFTKTIRNYRAQTEDSTLDFYGILISIEPRDLRSVYGVFEDPHGEEVKVPGQLYISSEEPLAIGLSFDKKQILQIHNV